MIEDLGKFLVGHTDPILNRLKNEMAQESEEMNYEKAAVLRDQIIAIEKVVERQKIISDSKMDSDVIALARSNGDSCVQIFFIRNGRLTGREYFILEGTEGEEDNEVIANSSSNSTLKPAPCQKRFCFQMSLRKPLLSSNGSISSAADKRSTLKFPSVEKKRDLVKMATDNAIETLEALKTQWATDTHKQSQALTEIQEALDLESPPNRIECYDISNIQGTAAVGSMVVFEQGIPNKKLYRRFNIKTVSGPDDFASMEEVLARRFKRWQAAQDIKEVGSKVDPSFSILPDLLIVDGGKGQLSRASKVLG